MNKPVIGIVPAHDAYYAPEDGKFPHYVLREAYGQVMSDAGGLPLVLPYLAAEDFPAVLDVCGGILLSGDPLDIDPAEYGEDRQFRVAGPAARRTIFERPFFLAALARGRPVLGICGGLQLINVALGGTLWQDIPAQAPGHPEHQQNFSRHLPLHQIRINKDSLLHQVLGVEELAVNSTHHQGIKAPGGGLRVTAQSADGIVEAVELPGDHFVLGVQWHPELLGEPHPRLFRALVERARSAR